MTKKSILLLFLFFSIKSFTQTPCESGMFSFKQKDGFYSHTLVKDGKIFPFRNQTNQDILYQKMCSKILLFQSDSTIKSIKYVNVKSSLIKTKASLIICYESFVDQILPFLKEEIDETTLISQKGIPFLTFTRVE